MDVKEIYLVIKNQQQYLYRQGIPPHAITTKVYLTKEDLLKIIAERNIINPIVGTETKFGTIYKFMGFDVEETSAEKSYVMTGLYSEDKE